MTRQISEAAQVAKIIRKHLKANGVSARVTTRDYNCVNVTLNNPLPAIRAAVESYTAQFEKGSFNGMTDCYEFDNCNGEIPQVKFLFIHTDYSDDVRNEARNYVDSNIEYFTEYEANIWTQKVINGELGSLWTSRKPRVTAA